MKWMMRKIRGIGSWIAHLPLVAKVILAAVLVVVVFGGSFGSYRMYDYTQNDPEFCRSCHTMETCLEQMVNQRAQQGRVPQLPRGKPDRRRAAGHELSDGEAGPQHESRGGHGQGL